VPPGLDLSFHPFFRRAKTPTRAPRWLEYKLWLVGRKGATRAKRSGLLQRSKSSMNPHFLTPFETRPLRVIIDFSGIMGWELLYCLEKWAVAQQR
jgi:hypothetical protein